MKAIYIALKDLTRSFRSAFLLAFMFGVPLGVTGMFYLMFGSQSTQVDAVYQPPVTHVVIANLDQGDPALLPSLQAAAPGVDSLGDTVVNAMQSEDMAKYATVELVDDAAAAKASVDDKSAGVAVIIPADFSASYASGKGVSTLAIYEDPDQATSGMLVRAVLGQLLDTLAGVRIAVDVAMTRPEIAAVDLPAVAAGAAQQYMQSLAQSANPAALMTVRAPAKADAAQPANLVASIIGPIMCGMMIFFAFFTGGATAQSILTEDEEGTLARLFTTPTRQSTILGGKFLAVGLTVLVQIILLLAVANLIFHIQWGALASTILAAAGVIICAATFGIFLTSLLKSTRQGGAVYGGLMTVTGMVGMLPIFTSSAGNANPTMEAIALLTPQGWAIRGLTQSMHGAGAAEVALTLLALLGLSALFMGLGIWRFQRRYA